MLKELDEDLVAVALQPKQIKMHRAYPIGFSVLEKSKLVTKYYQD